MTHVLNYKTRPVTLVNLRSTSPTAPLENTLLEPIVYKDRNLEVQPTEQVALFSNSLSQWPLWTLPNPTPLLSYRPRPQTAAVSLF